MLPLALLCFVFTVNIFLFFLFFTDSLIFFYTIFNIFYFADIHLVWFLFLPIRSLSHELLYILMADDWKTKSTFWYIHLNMQMYLYVSILMSNKNLSIYRVEEYFSPQMYPQCSILFSHQIETLPTQFFMHKYNTVSGFPLFFYSFLALCVQFMKISCHLCDSNINFLNIPSLEPPHNGQNGHH